MEYQDACSCDYYDIYAIPTENVGFCVPVVSEGALVESKEFLVQSGGKYIVSGLPKGGTIRLYASRDLGRPNQLIRNGSIVTLEAEPYILTFGVGFRGDGEVCFSYQRLVKNPRSELPFRY